MFVQWNFVCSPRSSIGIIELENCFWKKGGGFKTKRVEGYFYKEGISRGFYGYGFLIDEWVDAL